MGKKVIIQNTLIDIGKITEISALYGSSFARGLCGTKYHKDMLPPFSDWSIRWKWLAFKITFIGGKELDISFEILNKEFEFKNNENQGPLLEDSMSLYREATTAYERLLKEWSPSNLNFENLTPKNKWMMRRSEYSED